MMQSLFPQAIPIRHSRQGGNPVHASVQTIGFPLTHAIEPA